MQTGHMIRHRFISCGYRKVPLGPLAVLVFGKVREDALFRSSETIPTADCEGRTDFSVNARIAWEESARGESFSPRRMAKE